MDKLLKKTFEGKVVGKNNEDAKDRQRCLCVRERERKRVRGEEMWCGEAMCA